MASRSDGTREAKLFVMTFSAAQRKLCRQIRLIWRDNKCSKDLTSGSKETKLYKLKKVYKKKYRSFENTNKKSRTEKQNKKPTFLC